MNSVALTRLVVCWSLVAIISGQDLPISCDMGYIESKNHIYKTNITECVHPETETEIGKIILDAIDRLEQNENELSTIRAIGTSISYSGLGMLDEYEFNSGRKYDHVIVINTTTNLRQIIDLNIEESTVTFQPGLSVMDILQYLESEGFALQYFDGPTFANFVGWFNSGTAGKSGIVDSSDPETLVPPMANNVVALKMVVGNGSSIQFGNGVNDELLPAVLISFGSMGIITEVTVRIKPLFYATRYETVVYPDVNTTEAVRDTLENEILPYSYNYNITRHQYRLFDSGFRTFHSYNYQHNITNNNNSKCWELNDNNETVRTSIRPCTDVYYKTFQSPPTVGLRNQEVEYWVKSEYLVEIYVSIIDYFLQHKNNKTKLWNDTYQLFQIENDWEILVNFKWGSGDNIWLSVGYNETQMVMLNIYFSTSNERDMPHEMYLSWINPIYHMLNEKYLSVTPVRSNWAKMSISEYCWLAQSYPKLEEFKSLRAEFDPYNFFLNSFTRDKLGICDDECCCTNMTCIKAPDDDQSDDELDWIMIGVLGGSIFIVLLIIAIIVMCYCKRKKSKQNSKQNELTNLLH